MPDDIKIIDGLCGSLVLQVESARIDEYVKVYNSKPEGFYGIHISKFHGYMFEDLNFLKQLKGLKAITIQDGFADMSALCEQVELEFLIFEELQQPLDLALFPKLSYLRGTWSKKLKNLNQAKCLEHLGLWKYKPTSTNLIELAALPELDFLELNMANLTTLAGIESLKNLSELNCSYVKNLVDITSLATTNLQSVHFQNCKKITDYSCLENLPSLKRLNIEKCADIVNLEFIGQSLQLEKLFFHGTTLVSGDLSPCLKHPKLNTISYNDKKYYSHKSDELHYQLSHR